MLFFFKAHHLKLKQADSSNASITIPAVDENKCRPIILSYFWIIHLFKQAVERQINKHAESDVMHPCKANEGCAHTPVQRPTHIQILYWSKFAANTIMWPGLALIGSWRCVGTVCHQHCD